MKKVGLLLSIALLVSLPGCSGRRKAKADKKNKRSEVNMNIDIPVAQDGIRSFFDEDLKEFTAEDDFSMTAQNDTGIDPFDAAGIYDEFAWIDDVDLQEFKVVQFDFNSYELQKDQEAHIAYDIERAKQMIKENPQATVIIEGHACHSAGSRIYNLALSEKRAKVLADKFVSAGIPKDSVKIVGRGAEIPAMVNGKPVTGDRAQQAPNRRDELRVIYS